MLNFFIGMCAIAWCAATASRIYRQARFYQIEEYHSWRYLSWLPGARWRWLPMRAVFAGLAPLAISLVVDSIPGSPNIIAFIAMLIGGLVAGIPAPEGEIKKAFVRTQRASRLLAAAFAMSGIFLLMAYLLIASNTEGRTLLFALAIVNTVVLLLAPIWLILGNQVMQPVEGFLRYRFIRQAKTILSEVQPRIVAITGSYGKTTTKNFARDLLNIRYKAYATPKSYNTMMGLCLAINRDMADDYSVEYLIAEMGMYVPGEIARMCELTPPDISLVIEVGPQHLERAGSMENIARAKYEIIEGLKPYGLGIFNWDNPYVRAMYERGYPKERIAVSREADPTTAPADGPRFIAYNIRENRTALSFDVVDRDTGQRAHFVTPIAGLHNVTNLLMATAVAVYEGISLSDIAFRVRNLQPAENRLVIQTLDGGINLINDSYSANPVGAMSALRVLGMHGEGARVLITPGMVELGPVQYDENYKLGRAATEYATHIILVGSKQTQALQDGIRQTTFPAENLMVVETLSEAIAWYKTHLQPGDTVLFLNDLPDTY